MMVSSFSASSVSTLYVHKEMAKVGVNLRLLHDEYKERCRRSGKVAMGYTKFCGDYGDWTVANNLTKRIEHRAGQSTW